MAGIVTLTAIRSDMLEAMQAIEPRFTGDRVTTGAGTSATTSQINALGHRKDNSFIDTHWLIFPDGPDGSGVMEAQLISAFDQADGSGDTIITVHESYSAQPSNGIAAYISRIHPEDIRIALNRAVGDLYPDVYVPRRWNHVTNSWVWNGFWDFWDKAVEPTPLWWAVSDALLTTSKEVDGYFGNYSLKLVADGAGARYLKYQPQMPALLNRLDTQAITLHAMVYATSASEGGVSISDGAGNGSTVFHDGDSKWTEVISAERTMAEGRPGSPIEFRLHAALSATVRFGPVWTEGGEDAEYIPVPPEFRRGPSRIGVSGTEWPSHKENLRAHDGFQLRDVHPAIDRTGDVSVGHMVDLTTKPTAKRLMVLEGEDYLSQATLETDAYELTAPRDELLKARAMFYLKFSLAQQVGTGAAGIQRALAQDWESIYDRLLEQDGMRMKRVPIALGGGLGPPGDGMSSFRTWNDE